MIKKPKLKSEDTRSSNDDEVEDTTIEEGEKSETKKTEDEKKVFEATGENLGNITKSSSGHEDVQKNLEMKSLVKTGVSIDIDQPNEEELLKEYRRVISQCKKSFWRGNRIEIFQTIGDGHDFNQFEKILVSNEDKSAIISHVLMKFEDETFWTEKVKLPRIMRYYYENQSANLLNFFTILICNWFNQTGEPREYFLVQKFEAFELASFGNLSVFDVLFDTYNNENFSLYFHICIKILYHYFDEVNRNFDPYNTDYPASSVLHDSNMSKLIEKALRITPPEYKTQVIKILLTFIRNTKDQEFADLKKDIIETFEYDLTYASVCKISYNSIVKYFDGKFFELLFYLKENCINKFRVGFDKYISEHKQLLGEYWRNALKMNAQLLFHIARNQGLVDTQEFILISSSIFELKHSIASSLLEFAEFQIVFVEPLKKSEEKLLNTLVNFVDEDLIINIDDYEVYANIRGFERLFVNTPTIRKLLFGRRTLDSLSLFEVILTKNRTSMYEKSDNTYVLDHIWNEFHLWDIPEVLTMRNPVGMSLMDYVLETDNDYHLIFFLMPKSSDYIRTIQKPSQFMMLKNALYYDCNRADDDRSLVEYHLNLIDKNNRSDPHNIQNIFYLFEEISIFNLEQKKQNAYIKDLFETITKEESEHFDGRNELKLPRKHFLIGIMMIYWTREAELISISFRFEKQSNEDGYLFFRLLFHIICGREAEFHKDFSSEIEKLENCFKNIYELESTYDTKHQKEDSENIFHFYEKYSTNFFFVLLYAAIKFNRKGIIEQIFRYDNFLITVPTFPSNMEATDVHHFTTLKFLENKYEIGRADIPKSWITRDVLEKFLDSRIASFGGFYKVDCRFMLPYYNHDVNIKSPSEVNEDLLLNEDYDTMEYITNDHDLKPLVTHPVMEMIIKVKIHKYNRILLWNQIAFFALYIFPTLFLTYLNHSNQSPNYWLNSAVNLIRIPFVACREYFQYKFVYREEYFKETSNFFDLGLIILPLLLFIPTTIQSFYNHSLINAGITFFEVLNIAFMIGATCYLFSNMKFSMYMKCFRKIFGTYMSIFINFFPLFLGFLALSFIILNKNVSSILPGETWEYISMYAGELAFENNRITGFIQGVFFTLIVILVINKFNLVLSIAINDINVLMHQSKEVSLIYNAQKYVQFAKRIRIFHAITEYKEKKSLSERIMYMLIKLIIREYPYIHRIQTLYIDKQTKNVFVDVERSVFESNDSISKILGSNKNLFRNWFQSFKLDVETMDAIKKIVNSFILKVSKDL
ncbi:uncharacterized protein [Chironomus tepperi]|uniref:uncharacterized protein n=1 Tax=Chironomus tepperi TaxID=113505 RepID=UPI00391F7109